MRRTIFGLAVLVGLLHPIAAEAAIDGTEGGLDLGELVARTREMRREARRLNQRIANALAQGDLDVEVADAVNQKLMKVELNWLNAAGIPGRPWFKHVLYAPRYTYAALSLPGVREAAEAENWELARTQLETLVGRLEAASAATSRAATQVPAP